MPLACHQCLKSPPGECSEFLGAQHKTPSAFSPAIPLCLSVLFPLKVSLHLNLESIARSEPTASFDCKQKHTLIHSVLHAALMMQLNLAHPGSAHRKGTKQRENATGVAMKTGLK